MRSWTLEHKGFAQARPFGQVSRLWSGVGWVGVVAASSGGFGVVGLGGCTFSRRVLPSSCPWPRRPVAKMTSRPRSRCGVVGCRGVVGGALGGLGLPRVGLLRSVTDFSRQVLVQLALAFPWSAPAVTSRAQSPLLNIFSPALAFVELLRSLAPLACSSRGPVPSSWPRVLTSAPFLRPSLAQGRRGTRSPQEAARFQPRVVGTSERSPSLLQRRFEKPSRTNQLRTSAPPDAASQFYHH